VQTEEPILAAAFFFERCVSLHKSTGRSLYKFSLYCNLYEVG
jgi:hypothetical protein